MFGLLYMQSAITAVAIAAAPFVLALALACLASALPSRHETIQQALSVVVICLFILSAFIIVFMPFLIMDKMNNTVTAETRYAIVNAEQADNDGHLSIKVEDENGRTTEITSKISNFQTSENGDYFIVKEYESSAKSFAIAYEDDSPYADIFDAARLQQDILQ